MKKEYLLAGLCCGTCARKIETAARALSGVESARVDRNSTSLTLEIHGEGQSLLGGVRRIVSEIEDCVEVSEKPVKHGRFRR